MAKKEMDTQDEIEQLDMRINAEYPTDPDTKDFEDAMKYLATLHKLADKKVYIPLNVRVVTKKSLEWFNYDNEVHKSLRYLETHSQVVKIFRNSSTYYKV